VINSPSLNRRIALVEPRYVFLSGKTVRAADLYVAVDKMLVVRYFFS
jgi:hypothetical protein